jgi:polyhydroxybutyrate depolymerase
MFQIFFLSVLATLVKSQCSPSNLSPGTYYYSIDSAGVANRNFSVHIPVGYNNQAPVPLLFNLHGFTMDGEGMERMSQFRAKADQEGFVVVNPDGVTRQWNPGCMVDTGVDDTTFILDMIDFVKGVTCVNSRRIYATGFSAGAFMAHTLGWNSSVFAAVAPHSGMMCEEYVNYPSQPPIPTYHMHGNEDSIVPYNASLNPFFPSAPKSLLQWADFNGCVGTPNITWQGLPGDSYCETYTSCENGVQSTLCTLDGWGHDWYTSGAPAGSGEYDSTNFAWAFLSQWELPL